MTGIMCALAGAGGAAIPTATVTCGTYYDPNPSFSFRYNGYVSGLMGSVSPTTWGTTGFTIAGLYYLVIYNIGYTGTSFQLFGEYPNSGWTTININGTVFNRSAASYDFNGERTTWSWSPASDLYGTSGTRVVTWP